MLSIAYRSLHAVHKTVGRIIRIQSYLLTGRKPWTIGYTDYRRGFVHRVIGDPHLCELFRLNQELPRGYGTRLDDRVIEYPWVISRLSDRAVRLLDAGSTLNAAFILELPILRNKSIVIYNLAPEGTVHQANVSYIYGDLRQTILKDETFEEIVCISTLEHIGMDSAMFYSQDKRYAEFRSSDYREVMCEFHRLLAPGGRLLLTVPYGRYENFVWFQQFDHNLLNDAIEAFDGTVMSRAFYRYTPGGWILSNAGDCSDCEYYHIHARSDYDSDYAAASRAVACVELSK
jgi:hypothetical protein